jgi:hypothetical protein
MPQKCHKDLVDPRVRAAAAISSARANALRMNFLPSLVSPGQAFWLATAGKPNPAAVLTTVLLARTDPLRRPCVALNWKMPLAYGIG